jgi:hypothetical protein
MEFNENINPGTIIASFLLIIALLGMIGNVLTHYDNERGDL